MNLDLIERRGKLTYKIGNEYRTMDGNFRLSMDGNVIEARQVRGRNRWQLCSRDAAEVFIEIREWDK